MPPEDIQRRCITPSVLYPGTPVVLMTTLNDDGSSNISPLSSFWALGNRVVLANQAAIAGQGATRNELPLRASTRTVLAGSKRLTSLRAAETPFNMVLEVRR